MAGLGRRTFAPGEVLTASNVMNYLQDQAVMNFAGTAARGSAIGTAVSQGMVSYLDDSNSLEVYKTTGTAVAGWEPVNLTQSPNVIINGGFDIWQRGTSFTSFGATNVFTADRFYAYRQSLAAGLTISRQSSGLAGFQYCARIQRDSGNTSTTTINFIQDLESANCIPFAGKPVTFSFYARAGANYSSTSSIMVTDFVTGTGTDQSLRSGYTGGVTTSTNHTLTTSWQRYTVTLNIASNVTQIGFVFKNTPVGTAGAADFFEVTGVQLEAGQTATPFRRNANSIQGELAACQRYYFRTGNVTSGAYFGIGISASSTLSLIKIDHPVAMRTAPTLSEYSGVNISDAVNYSLAVSSLGINGATNISTKLDAVHSATATTVRTAILRADSGSSYVALGCEL